LRSNVSSRAVLIFLLLELVIAGIVYGLYRTQAAAFDSVMRAEERNLVLMGVQRLAAELSRVSSDARYLAEQEPLGRWLASGDPSALRHMTADYLAFARRKAIYDQVRFMDASGREVVRVNWNDGQPAEVPPDHLQDKVDRYYVHDTLKLGPGEVYVSPFDLNVERGAIEQPIKPMLRFGVPVFDAEGRKRGLVVLNYLGRILLDRVGALASAAAGQIWLLNTEGYWLLGPTYDDEWAFMYSARRDRSFARAYPSAWQAMAAGGQAGQFSTGGDLFSYARISPDGIANAPPGVSGPDSTAAARAWTVVARVPAALMARQTANTERQFALALVALAVIAAVVAFAIARHAVRRGSAEQSLRESAARLRAVTETASDGIVSADGRGDITYFNPAAERIFGYEAREIVGQPLTRLMPERFQHAHLAGLRRFVATGEAKVVGRTVELIGRRKSGEEFPVELSLASWVLGRDVFFTGVLRDITSRAAADRLVRASEARFRALLESAPDAVVITRADGRIVLVNAQTERLFGYGRDELIWEPVERLIPDRYHSGHVGHRSGYAATPRVRSMGEGLELYGKRKDGTEFPVAISLSPVDTEQGKLFVASVRDVTEQREAERRIRDNETRFRALIESAPDAVVITGKDGRIVLVNAQTERLFGYGRDELVGRTVEALIPERYHAKHVGYRTGYAGAPRVRPMGEGQVLYGRRKDGTEFPVSISLSPVDTVQGKLFVASVRDVTEQREAQRRLEDLTDRLARDNAALATVNKELEAFSYSVSHDLRSPLRAIDGFAQALAEDWGERLDEEGRTNLNRVRGAAQRMGHLIDDLLKLSRVSRAEISLADVDLGAMAREIVETLRQHDPGRAVEADIADGLGARGDARLLRVALENLLSNAWKFTTPRHPGRIEFHRVDHDGRPAFRVRDNGVGFDMAYAGKLFGAFQRLHDGREFPGTGIGLATVQRVIHKHGGRVWAEAQPDKGAAFYFTL
jgi:PAS domain S-box-containing protein